MMPYQILLEEVKNRETSGAILYCLKNMLEQMQAQLGYVRSLDKETITVWANGNKTERNRLDWIADTEREIADCQAHIAEMEQISA